MARAEVENVLMPGGIVMTKHQATLIKEVVCLVLLMVRGIFILEGAEAWFRLIGLAPLELIFGLRTSPFLVSRLVLSSTHSSVV
jgi:hypothetical protein